MDTKRYEELQSKIDSLYSEIEKIREEQRELSMVDILDHGLKVGDFIKIDQCSEPIVYMRVVDIFRDYDFVYINGEKFVTFDGFKGEEYAMWDLSAQASVKIDNIDDEITHITKEEYDEKFNEMLEMMSNIHKNFGDITFSNKC